LSETASSGCSCSSYPDQRESREERATIVED
jgi:hypothetical protein